jgi:hypothetical protein
VIYRCEKNYMRRRLQETFHISPSGGTISTNGNIPSISVSVQTEPLMAGMNGNGAILNGQTLLANGHLMGNGGSSGHHSNGGALGYATLPHNTHHLTGQHHHHQMAASQANGNGEEVNGGSGGGNAPPPPLWPREMTNAQSYRDVREGIMNLANGNGHSRENTLSRDAHIHLSVSFP